MALVGYEWVIVAAIILVILLWGPKRLPELARSLGQARKEFKKTVENTSSENDKGKAHD